MFTGFKLINDAGFSKFTRLKDYRLSEKSQSYLLKMELFFLLYLSRFSYENLPDGMNIVMGNRNYIDAMLFFQPSVCFFEDKKLGVQCLPTTGEYKFNIVGRPVEWTARAYNGKTWNLNEDNSVIMYNDEAMSIPFLQLDYICNVWVEAEKTLKQNLEAQRQPFIIEGDEETLKTAQSIWQQLREFNPVIYKRKKNKKDNETIETKVFQTGVPLIAKELDDVGMTYFNKGLTYLGINNINVQDKRERLITSEASANDMLIQTYYTSQYKQRNLAIEQVNKKFGIDIKFDTIELKSMVTAIQNEYSAGIVQAETKNINKGENKNAD